MRSVQARVIVRCGVTHPLPHPLAIKNRAENVKVPTRDAEGREEAETGSMEQGARQKRRVASHG